MKIPNIEHAVFIEAPIEKVWQTLTTSEGWNSWFTDGTEIDLKEGGYIKLRWKNFGIGHYTTEDGGTILKVIPNIKFIFQWSPASSPTTVAFNLEQLGSGTKVLLTETGYPESEKDLQVCIGCAVGWGEALTLLKFFLEHGITYGKVPEK